MIHETAIGKCSARGVRLHEMRHVLDRVRGNLAVCDFSQELPFQPQRCFLTYAIPDDQTRGEHAHRQCSRFLVRQHGQCHVQVDDGDHCKEFCLNRPTPGVLIPPMVRAVEPLHSRDFLLMVLASIPYGPEDCIRDYGEFRAMVKTRASTP